MKNVISVITILQKSLSDYTILWNSSCILCQANIMFSSIPCASASKYYSNPVTNKTVHLIFKFKIIRFMRRRQVFMIAIP